MAKIMERTQIYNYADIFFSCLVPEDTISEYKTPFHALIYVYSGEVCIDDRGHKITVKAGEYVFLKRDNHVKLLKHAADGAPYKAISIRFERNFLRTYFNTLDRTKMPVSARHFKEAAVPLVKTPCLDSLFLSLSPYMDANIRPADEIIRMKMQEAMFCLLSSNEKFYPTLFDFNEAWKIDLMKFMEENYKEDMTLEEYAMFTGRSLATFKRDFAKLSDLPPEKWLIRKRLEAAYDLLRNKGKKVSDVYMEVGFKNRSHFTVAFKKQYGFSPAYAM